MDRGELAREIAQRDLYRQRAGDPDQRFLPGHELTP